MNELSTDTLIKLLWSDGYDTGQYVRSPDGMTYLEVKTSGSDILVGPVWDLETDDPIIDTGDLKIFETYDSSWIVLDEIEDCEGLVSYISEKY